MVLFQLAVVIGVVWWLLALFWLGRYDFASDHDTHARVFKLAPRLVVRGSTGPATG